VAEVSERVCRERGFPQSILCDNGPDFTSRTLDLWAYERGVDLSFIRPVDNAFIESFNEVRPHSSLDNLTPAELAEKARSTTSTKGHRPQPLTRCQSINFHRASSGSAPCRAWCRPC